MCRNEQNVVLKESSEVFGNHLKIVWILVLAITTAEDDVWAAVILSEKLLLIFSCFTTKMVIFGVIGLAH